MARCSGRHIIAVILILVAFAFGVAALAGDWIIIPTGPNTDYTITDPNNYYGGQCVQYRLLQICNACVPLKTEGSCSTYRENNLAAIAAGQFNGADGDEHGDPNDRGFDGPWKRHLAAGATALALIIVGELVGLVALAHAIMLAAERPYNWLAGRHHRATWSPTLTHTIFVFAGWLIYTCVVFTAPGPVGWDALRSMGARPHWGYYCAIVSFVLSFIAAMIICTCHRDVVVVVTTTTIPPHEHHYGVHHGKKGKVIHHEHVVEERRASMAA